MILLSWQINQLVILSFTKSFAWPKSDYGDFFGVGEEGILLHHVPASDAWCGEWTSGLWTAKPPGFYMASCCARCVPFQLCFCPLKTTSLSSKRACTGLEFTKGRTCSHSSLLSSSLLIHLCGFTEFLHSICCECGHLEGRAHIFFPLQKPLIRVF